MPEISLNTSMALLSKQLRGTCEGSFVVILINNGSNHNISKTNVVIHLGIPPEETKLTFKVYIGNGESLLCQSKSDQLQIQVQGYRFMVNFHVLEMTTTNLVVRVQWLETLANIQTIYKELTRMFEISNQQIHL